MSVPTRAVRKVAAGARVRLIVPPIMWLSEVWEAPQAAEDLDRAVRPDLRHHYSSPLGAHRWLAVCKDPTYGHGVLVRRIGRAMQGVIAALRADANARVSVTLTSLGSGDGAVDTRVLRALARARCLRGYCAVDSSFELLRRATSRAAADGALHRYLPVAAIWSDFSELNASMLEPPAHGSVRLFTLTGLTLGNHRESELLERIRGLMRAEDYLLLDARLHALGPKASLEDISAEERAGILRCYDSETQRRFVFGPVELATLATAADVEFGYELSRRVTVVPNALNVLVYCTGLHTRMRLSGAAVCRDRVDLCTITLYHYPDLVAWIAAAGFAPLCHSAEEGVAAVLLKRR